MTTFTPNKNIIVPAHGQFPDSWDVNAANIDYTTIDTALGGSTLLNATALSGDQILSTVQYTPLSLIISGAPAGLVRYVVPSGVGGQWIIRNTTASAITFASAAGGATLTVSAGTQTLVSCDGSSSGMVFSVSTPTNAAGSSGQIQVNGGGNLAAFAGLVYDGTTLGTSGLNVSGNTVVGAGAGSTLQIFGTAVSAPNGLNVNANSLTVGANTIAVGGILVAGDTITSYGVIHSTAGGIKFPDGTTQVTAAAGAGAPGANTQVIFNNGGAFAASAGLTFVSGTNTLSTANLTATTALTGASLSVSGGSALAAVTATTLSTSGAASLSSAAVAGALTVGGTGLFSTAAGGAVRFYQNTTNTPGFGNVTQGAAIESASDGAALYLSRVTGTGSLLQNTNTGTATYTSYYQAGSLIAAISLTAGTITYGTGSDYRRKNIHGPVSDAVARVKKLRPVNFAWKNFPDQPIDGFVAHEVAEVAPWAVHGEKDALEADGSIKIQTLDQSWLVPLLTAALQDAFVRIEALEAR